MKVETNTPRRIRAHVRRLFNTGRRTDAKGKPVRLRLIGPKHNGQDVWRFAVCYQGRRVCLGKPVQTRDEGRKVAPARFGVKAADYRPKAA